MFTCLYQAKQRLQGELKEQLRSRIESLDEHQAALEWARQYAELCGAEAKVVLTRSALLAGDYDAQVIKQTFDLQTRGVRLGHKLGQIGTKLDKSVTF